MPSRSSNRSRGDDEASENSSDDGTGPLELPDGRLVCRPHRLVVCGYCTVDYSFMDDVPGSEESYDSKDEELLLETPAVADLRNHFLSRFVDADGQPLDDTHGQTFPSEFKPPTPTSTPAELFPPGVSHRDFPFDTRFIHRDDPSQALIYTDGACLNNGRPNPKGGWAFVFKPQTAGQGGTVSHRLENKGPTGHEALQTSNRAELRAVLGALGFRAWSGEGFSTLVIAADSQYVVKGATTWTRRWTSNGWRTNQGTPVQNRDLWEKLLAEVEKHKGRGMDVQFWNIPREINAAADREAKLAARGENEDEYFQILGYLSGSGTQPIGKG